MHDYARDTLAAEMNDPVSLDNSCDRDLPPGGAGRLRKPSLLLGPARTGRPGTGFPRRRSASGGEHLHGETGRYPAFDCLCGGDGLADAGLAEPHRVTVYHLSRPAAEAERLERAGHAGHGPGRAGPRARACSGCAGCGRAAHAGRRRGDAPGAAAGGRAGAADAIRTASGRRSRSPGLPANRPRAFAAFIPALVRSAIRVRSS